MDKRDYYVMLYDFYDKLFNLNEKNIFEDYYFNNLSLAEISENLGVSRNAIYKHLKNVENKLLFYEDNLQLYHKHLELLKITKEIKNQEIVNKLLEL